MNEFDYTKYATLEAAWLAYRRMWLQQNPPLDNGYYLCGICARWVRADEVTLDHIRPRNLDNMFQSSNIQPAHGACNYKKGSKRWQPKVTKEVYDFLKVMSDM